MSNQVFRCLFKSLKAVTMMLLLLTFPSCFKKPPEKISGTVSRIISFAPSITETLFALGLGEKVVGVTRYCKYPSQTEKIDKIGGYTDINLEKVLSLKPDLIILQKEHQRKQIKFLTQHGIRFITIDNTTCANICSSFVKIGNVCGAEKKADSLVMAFKNNLQEKTITYPVPSVLMCIGRDNPGSGRISGAFIVSRSTLYNEMIEAAGGHNAYRDSLPQYLKISTEGIITLNPDIIIDLASSMSDYSCDNLIKDWNSLPMVKAVKNKQVSCVNADYATVPGPRIPFLIQDLRKIIQGIGTN